MQISARGDYAVRAALSLATAYPSLLSTQAIASEQDMPRKFLEAVLADLRRAGVVRAQRGAEGGYTLARPPREVTVGAILRAVEGPLAGVRGLRPRRPATRARRRTSPGSGWPSAPPSGRCWTR